MKFTITSDPVDQYNGRGVPGRYDAEFARLTPKNNCIVFDDFSEMEKVAQAMDGWIKRANLTGAKVKTTKAYKADGKPRCCHTCDYYLSSGLCDKFGQVPPDEFTQTIGACDQWEDMIPF